MTSAPGRFHQFSDEKISTSCGPWKPACSISPRNRLRSMTPSPIMPRSSSRSRVGTSQSQIWCARIWPLRPARAICAPDLRIPPGVIDVDGDADARAKRVAQIERLLERVHARAIAGVHRMQRFDGQRHMASARMRQHGGQSVGDHGARRRNILGRRRKTTHDHHQTIGAERRGFVDGALVVVDGGRPSPPCPLRETSLPDNGR